MLDFRICNQCRASHRARIPRLHSNLKRKGDIFLDHSHRSHLKWFLFFLIYSTCLILTQFSDCFSHFWSCQCNSQSFKWLTTRAQSTGQFDATKLAFELTKREIRSFFCSWTVYFMKARSGSFNLNHYCFF